VNERLTEEITRDLINKYKSLNKEKVYVDEQISSNKLIKKILGNLKPDFIIDFKNNTDNIIIVIECKADSKKQTQALKDAEEKYASKLKESFNVFYYGISGQNPQRILIEGRLWIKNHQRPFPKIYTKLLTYQNIKKLISELTNIKVDNNLKCIKSFNDKLHQMSIPESERPVLIGCFLIALSGPSINLENYNGNNECLKEYIITCAKFNLKSKLDPNKVKTICSYYDRLLSNNVWISEEEVDSYGSRQKNTNLNYFLKELNEKIMPLINNNNWDIMGEFYREFIKYATEDKKTGLVLTPTHITDFFCELINIQNTDIVLDPCCGTGGFLIAAMKYMCQKSQNEEEIKKIKTKQLLGIEKRNDMWLHATVNMMMHGDGHTNIHQGNCFEYTTDNFKDYRPTVAFLNPPYNEASEQLRFIQKSLELITPKGKVVAIVQASATGNSKAVNNVKEEILKNHTLLASFSCPKELFHGIAGVITNILIFESGIPHNKTNATFLGWFKDDGFIKQKTKRIKKGTEWKKIKKKWIDTYNNKKEIKEDNIESKMQILDFNDEWCIEAYLKPDLPSKKDFMLTLKEYILHELEVMLDDEINRDF
jgi:type I restriction enzyme M protein